MEIWVGNKTRKSNRLDAGGVQRKDFDGDSTYLKVVLFPVSIPFKHCSGGSEKSMNAIRPGIIALTCFWLLMASVSSFTQTHNKTTAAYPNNAAIVSYSDAPALSLQYLNFSPNQTQINFQEQANPTFSDVPAPWQQDLGLPPGSSQANAQEQATAAFLNSAAIASGKNVWALLQQDMASSSAQSNANAQQQTKPSSGNEPSLKGLGFPPGAIQGSAKEQALLDKRSHMLQIHQKLGLLAAIPMVAAIITGPGAKGHHGLPGSPTGRDVHAGLGILTTGLYLSSAYFAIRAPKIPGTKSYGLIRLHKALAWIHGPGMILTPILGAIAYSQLSRGERVHGIAKYHSWVAYTTAAAYGAAILSVTIK